jgi:hypothetical protein
MAVRFATGSSEANALTGLAFLYSVETPVGQKADNKRIADIQLVQLFLRDFYSSNTALFKKLPKPGGRTVQGILLDGKVGGQTIGGITEFQKFIKRSGPSGVIVDGRVSVPTGVRVAGTRHVFTIIELNFFFFNSGPVNSSFNGNLEDHPVVKASLPELASDIRRRKA